MKYKQLELKFSYKTPKQKMLDRIKAMKRLAILRNKRNS